MTEITYNLELADMKAFHRHFQRVTPATRRANIVLLVLMTVLSLDLTWRHAKGPLGYRVIYYLITFAIFLVIGFTVARLFTWLVQSRMHRDAVSCGLLCEHTITLTPDAMIERTAVNDSRAKWSGLYRIDVTPGHIFIFTQPNMAHVIPWRAFPSKADGEAFLATARRFFDSAKSTTPLP